MDELMSCVSGRGKELYDLLAKEFGLPECVQQFEVSFHRDDVVICRCTWIATASPASDMARNLRTEWGDKPAEVHCGTDY